MCRGIKQDRQNLGASISEAQPTLAKLREQGSPMLPIRTHGASHSIRDWPAHGNISLHCDKMSDASPTASLHFSHLDQGVHRPKSGMAEPNPNEVLVRSQGDNMPTVISRLDMAAQQQWMLASNEEHADLDQVPVEDCAAQSAAAAHSVPGAGWNTVATSPPSPSRPLVGWRTTRRLQTPTEVSPALP